jgi:hypothetical protein
VNLLFSEEDMSERYHHPRPSSTYSCSDETDFDGVRRPLVDVFLLYHPGTSVSGNEDVLAMFRQWIQSLGCRVYDISDPEMVIRTSILYDPKR